MRSQSEVLELETPCRLREIWESADTFISKIKPKELADTRQKVVSLSASIFDPVGFLAPFFIRAKIFLQTLWMG